MRSRSYASATGANAIVYREITGWPKNVTGRLNQRLSALCRHGAYHVKIGITNSPSTRWKQAYQSNGWSRMHVIYASARHEHVCEIERALIERLDAYLVPEMPWYYNGVAGGGGRKPVNPPYYLYIVTAPKYARIIY